MNGAPPEVPRDSVPIDTAHERGSMVSQPLWTRHLDPEFGQKGRPEALSLDRQIDYCMYLGWTNSVKGECRV